MRSALLLVCLLLMACPSGGDDDDDDSTADDRPVLPDPGTATDDWGSALVADDDRCCSTPETAWPVGTVTMDAGYIQGVIDETLQFFYVFRADDDLTEFTFPLWFEEVHLHDGAGQRFGDEIAPSSTDGSSATFPLQGGGVYVIEIVSAFEGFF